MNAYAKIGIKIGVVIVICVVIIVAYEVLFHRTKLAEGKEKFRQIQTQTIIKGKLDALLEYEYLLPNIRFVQRHDMATFRNLVPPADTFSLTNYLRRIHHLLSSNHLQTNGIVILNPRKAVGKTDFAEAFESDVIVFGRDVNKIMAALDFFKENLGDMNNLLTSYRFHQMMSTEAFNFKAVIGGIESHSFSMNVRGSYRDIKKFTFDIYNMRPRTALINFQMSPVGMGTGRMRIYSANFTLITYCDANEPPPLLQMEPTNMEPLEAVQNADETGDEEPSEDV